MKEKKEKGMKILLPKLCVKDFFLQIKEKFRPSEMNHLGIFISILSVL